MKYFYQNTKNMGKKQKKPLYTIFPSFSNISPFPSPHSAVPFVTSYFKFVYSFRKYNRPFKPSRPNFNTLPEERISSPHV